MEYIELPPSRESVKRAGSAIKSAIKNNQSSNKDTDRALDIISRWRAFHAIPMNSLRSSLRGKIKKLQNSSDILISRRLKRMPSILNKMLRIDGMSISNMQDIAGVRVIFPNMDLLLAFKHACEETYKSSETKKITAGFVLVPVGNEDRYNYIDNPKKDGYRSLHQVYRFQSKRYPELKGMQVELQLRTQLQHYWATAVETLGLILNASLKSGEGDEQYKEFFRLCGALFAYDEKTNVQSDFAAYTQTEIIEKIISLNKSINITTLLSGTTIVTNVIQRSGSKANNQYYLVQVDLDLQKVTYMEYSEKQIEEAEFAYKTLEKSVQEEKRNVEVVLISIDSINNLRKTYPNYYLDATEFLKKLSSFGIN